MKSIRSESRSMSNGAKHQKWVWRSTTNHPKSIHNGCYSIAFHKCHKADFTGCSSTCFASGRESEAHFCECFLNSGGKWFQPHTIQVGSGSDSSLTTIIVEINARSVSHAPSRHQQVPMFTPDEECAQQQGRTKLPRNAQPERRRTEKTNSPRSKQQKAEQFQKRPMQHLPWLVSVSSKKSVESAIVFGISIHISLHRRRINPQVSNWMLAKKELSIGFLSAKVTVFPDQFHCGPRMYRS